MKKVITGGFLSLIGTIWTLAILITASNNLATSWITAYGRLFSTIIDMKMTLPLILAACVTIAGILMMLIESFKKEN